MLKKSLALENKPFRGPKLYLQKWLIIFGGTICSVGISKPQIRCNLCRMSCIWTCPKTPHASSSESPAQLVLSVQRRSTSTLSSSRMTEFLTFSLRLRPSEDVHPATCILYLVLHFTTHTSGHTEAHLPVNEHLCFFCFTLPPLMNK